MPSSGLISGALSSRQAAPVVMFIFDPLPFPYICKQLTQQAESLDRRTPCLWRSSTRWATKCLKRIFR